MAVTNYVLEISAEQADKLQGILETEENWEVDDAPYARFRARKNKTTVVAYQSGKLVIQGRGTEDLVQFIIEPRIVGEVRMGYESHYAREERPEMFQPHAGMDESGKGDFFGPMVTACCYTDDETTERLFELGVQDSKAIKSDKKIRELAKGIRDVLRGRYTVLRIRNASYNGMYERMNNVNTMLAWGHGRVLENLLERRPDCPRFLVDQFARNRGVIQKGLLDLGKGLIFEQRTKAEDDVAVAAASILAREAFIDELDVMGEEFGMTFPRGASQAVIQAAARFIRTFGEDRLDEVAKLHFRTTDQAIDLANT